MLMIEEEEEGIPRRVSKKLRQQIQREGEPVRHDLVTEDFVGAITSIKPKRQDPDGFFSLPTNDKMKRVVTIVAKAHPVVPKIEQIFLWNETKP